MWPNMAAPWRPRVAALPCCACEVDFAPTHPLPPCFSHPALAAMPILQCGFLASGAASHGNSKDICSCTPAPIASVQPDRPCQGGWGFALATTSDGDLFAWGVNAPTLLKKTGGRAGGRRKL